MKIAFSPSVYEHAAALIGRSPWDASRDADLMFAAHRAAYIEYRHAPIVVGIDIYNLEAEAYGGVIVQPGGNGIPAITQPIFRSCSEAFNLKCFDVSKDGRLPMVIEVGCRLKAEFPEAEVRVPVSGPFSIAVSLRSIEGLCEEVVLEPDAVASWLMRLAENQAAFCRAIVAAGLDIAFFESAAAPPMLSPRQFHDIELPALKRIMHLAAEATGHAVPCVIGGDTTPILPDILSTGTGYVVAPFETNQSAFMAASAHRPDVRVRINMDLRIVSCGPKAAILAEVDRVLALAASRPNCVLGTGALPYETPPEHVHLIRNYVA